MRARSRRGSESAALLELDVAVRGPSGKQTRRGAHGERAGQAGVGGSRLVGPFGEGGGGSKEYLLGVLASCPRSYFIRIGRRCNQHRVAVA